MKTNLEFLIMIIYTANALPIRNPAKEAQDTRKDSADASPKFHTLSGSSIKQLRLNFLDGLQNVMDDWKKSREKAIFSDPSSEIKKLNTAGRSRIKEKDTAKVMKLTDSQISQIKENYKANLTDTEIKLSEKETEENNPVHKSISGRSKVHNEPTSDIYIWSSNALTDKQWEKIQKNVQENEDEIKHDYDNVEKDIEKYDNHTSKTADGRHRNVNMKNVTEEPKYYSFSKSEWDELKQNLHKHLIGEDEKILKVNEDPTRNLKHSGRDRNEKVESPSLPKWSLWSSYALKPSEWNQLKQNIHHNEFIMNKTKNNIDPVGRVRSNVEDFSSKSYKPSAKDHINAVIVKPVTGERLYNLRKNFDWDRLLESISSKDSNTAYEDKDGISNVDISEVFNNQNNYKNKKPINKFEMGRSRKVGRQRGIMPSLVLDDDDEEFNNFEDGGSDPLNIEKDIIVGVDESNFASDSPGSELKNDVNTFTSTSTYLTDGILDYDTTDPLQLNPNIPRENYIFQQSVESDNSTITIVYDTTTPKENDIFQQSVGKDNSSSTIEYNTTMIQSVENNDSTSTIAYDSSDTEKSDTTEFVDFEYSTEFADFQYSTEFVDFQYSTEFVDFEYSTRENYVKIAIETDLTEIMDSTTVEYENGTRENYVKIAMETDPTEIMDSTTVEYENSTRENYVKIKMETDPTDIIDSTTEENEKSTRDTYIKIETETDPTEIVDTSTLTANNDADVHDTTVMNDTFTKNALNKDATQYIGIDDYTTEKDYYINDTNNLNKNESEYTPSNYNTTTEVYIINLSESDFSMSTAEVMNSKENISVLYYGTTMSDENYSTTTKNHIIHSNITDSNVLSNLSLNELSEFTTTDDSLTEEKVSTVSEAYQTTPEDKNYGFWGFFGIGDKSDSKMTTMNDLNDFEVNESSTISVMDPSTTTDSSSLPVIIDDNGYVVKENRFDIPEDMLLSTTTEVLLGNKDTLLILEEETSFENKDPSLNVSSQEIIIDEEISILTTDNFDSITEYFSTTNSEELGAVLSDSESVSTSIENPSSVNDSLPNLDLEINIATTNSDFEMEKTTLKNLDVGDIGEIASSEVMITTVDTIAEETIGTTAQSNNYNFNVDSDENNQSEDPKLDEDIVTFIPSSSADVIENMSIKSSSEMFSTTENMEGNEAGIYSGTEKLLNNGPNQPQELVGNEIPIAITTTVRPTTVRPTPVEPVSNHMPTWIILLIVFILALIVFVVGFVVVLRLKRQTGHIQLSP